MKIKTGNVSIKRKEGITTLILNAKSKYIIIDKKTLNDIYTIISSEIKKKDTSSIILYGNKHSFSTGFNIKDFLSTRGEVRKIAKEATGLLDMMERSDKIFISAVSGYCLGGGLELAMASDIIIASPDSLFSLPEIKLGLIPGADGIRRLVRQVGKRRAFDMLMTGRFISAKEALNIGLINEIVPKRSLIKRAEELAGNIDHRNPVAIKAIKDLALKAVSKNITSEEINRFLDCLGTPFAKQRIAEFFLKRKR